MLKCQNCGNEVEEGSKFCKSCGSEIKPEAPTASETRFCTNCGFEMDNSVSFCPQCGTSTGGTPQVVKTAPVANSDKSPALAAILSFLIVGLGQIYLGLTKKGIILFLAAIISGILMLVLIGWITWLIVWGYAIYDAYNSAEKMRQGIGVTDEIDLNNLF